jgi:hypothetical protein
LRRQIDDRIEPVLIERDFDEADFLGEIQKYAIKIASYKTTASRQVGTGYTRGL